MRSDLVQDLVLDHGAGYQGTLMTPSSEQRAQSVGMEASGVLTDLAALTPPFLVAAAFLIAVGAFVRHEMRAAKNQATEQRDEVDEPSASDEIGDRGSGSAR